MSSPSSIYFSGSLLEALKAFKDKPKWLLEPYLPAEGIVLFHGKFSSGKSPLCWRLAQSISEGIDFFGHRPEKTGWVIYVEIDEPLVVTKDRLQLLNPLPKRVHVFGMKPFSVIRMLLSDQEELERINTELNPALVLVNSLRKCHTLDDKDSTAPSLVYSSWIKLFPKSCILFVHHDKKSDKVDGRRVDPTDEDFSGSQAWINDAQIGLHLRPAGDRRSGLVSLEMTKSQLSAFADPLRLRLGKDGVNWVDAGATILRNEFLGLDTALPLMKRYAMVAEKCGVSESTVRRAVSEG